jgi:peptidoglycan hydrolase CwlO-like protein
VRLTVVTAVAAILLVFVVTRRDLGVAKGTLASRASAIYRSGGNSSELAELAQAGSFVDFFDRIDTMRRVGDQDATVLETIEALNARVERKERILRAAKAKATTATRAAKAAKEQMGTLLAQRQAKLDGVNADRHAADYRIESRTLGAQQKLRIELAPGGGFVAKLVPRTVE